MKNILLIIFVLVCACNITSAQQQILLDNPVRAGELTLFPSLSKSNEYYYVADKPRLATHPNGKPQFSFVRYVKNETGNRAGDRGISESELGGGIVHVLVELSVTDKQIKDAEADLQRVNNSGKIIGPVVFKSGTVALVSSVANADGGMAKQVVGLGAAPVLENQKSAVSIQLNKIGAKLLWEMFTQTTTPDLSFSFEMEIEGYQSPKNVTIEANFDRVYEHHAIEAAARTPVFAGEINAAFDNLVDAGAIKVTQIGTDEELDKLKETAYNQLINLMFDKVGGNGVPELSQLIPNQETSMLDRASDMLASSRAEAKEENQRIEDRTEKAAEIETQVRRAAQTRANQVRAAEGMEEVELPEEQEEDNVEQNDSNTTKKVDVPEVAIGLSYTMKKVKRKGQYKIDLNKYVETVRTLPFDYNPGNVRKSCEECFLEINLDDPLMKQREILVTLGLQNENDFKHVNFVSVMMKKQHQNGESTVDEIRIDRSKFNQTANLSKMVYGWKGDDNRPKWLIYDYNIQWSFAGGHKVETDWQPNTSSAISLEPPVVRKPVYIEIDEEFVKEQQVRGIEIKLSSKLGDKTETETASFKISKNELSKTVEILLPRYVEKYEYEIIYSIKGQDPKKSSKKSTDFGRIDVDRFL